MHRELSAARVLGRPLPADLLALDVEQSIDDAAPREATRAAQCCGAFLTACVIVVFDAVAANAGDET